MLSIFLAHSSSDKRFVRGVRVVTELLPDTFFRVSESHVSRGFEKPDPRHEMARRERIEKTHRSPSLFMVPRHLCLAAKRAGYPMTTPIAKTPPKCRRERREILCVLCAFAVKFMGKYHSPDCPFSWIFKE